MRESHPRQLARAQRKGLNFPVFLREKCACCELPSFLKLLKFNDGQNAATTCPTVPNDLLEREFFYCTHRCSRASTSSKLPGVLMSETMPASSGSPLRKISARPCIWWQYSADTRPANMIRSPVRRSCGARRSACPPRQSPTRSRQSSMHGTHCPVRKMAKGQS